MDENIIEKANKFAIEIKKEIAEKLTDTNIFKPEANPVSVFMAGSPGAGKTESSKRLVEEFAKRQNILRIDPDEFRQYFDDYKGNNSHLFQQAVSIIASKIHDYAIANSQSFIFDSTFTNFEINRENVIRSIKHKRSVQIYYVYQNPKQAWEFVKKREEKEGRRITKEDFIKKYFLAREVVNKIKNEFGNSVQVDLIVKNIDGTDKIYKENIDVIDNYIKEEYNMDTLREVLQN